MIDRRAHRGPARVLPSRRRARCGVSALLLSCGVPLVAAGQAAPCPALADSAIAWAPPLDRLVTQPASGLSLRAALDDVAARAKVRLSYATEALPLEREACTVAAPTSLGTALRALLHGVPVRPVASGLTQVALAPSSAAPTLARTMATLDRVLVTGSAVGASERPLPYVVDVVRGGDLRGAAAPTVATALNGAVPGLWVWNDSPTALLSRFGSVRGASSFGITSPKVFVDGIELANPLLLTRLTAEAVDRIEVIRGPQGASLYGADAISGVVNIQLRYDGAGGRGTDLQARATAGTAATAYASQPALAQEHQLGVRAGSATRSFTALTTFNTMGDVVPGGGMSALASDVMARRVFSRTIASGLARLSLTSAATPANPLVLDALSGFAQPLGSSQRLAQYTVGGSLRRAAGEHWSQAITVGLDGYRADGLAADFVPVLSAVDSALRATQGGADRGTVRATAVHRATVRDGVVGTTTLLADGALLREGTQAVMGVAIPPGGTTSPRGGALRSAPLAQWFSTVGTSVNGALAIKDALFLHAGLRGERNDGFTNASRLVLLPSAGVSLVRTMGGVVWKARVAYGEGVRPARTPARALSWRGVDAGAVSASLAPERQAGVEVGLDAFVGERFSVRMTRFDQRATSLIQQVLLAEFLAPGDTLRPPGGRPSRLAYALQNVGALTNRGWEFAARAQQGTVSLTGTLSLVDSRVARVATSYLGDLRTGDRMLGVPARTAGATLTWLPRDWQLQVGVSHAADWTNYDRLAIATAYATGSTPGALSGAALRAYWREYEGITRVRASLSRALTRSLQLRITGDNLLDRQLGEPDNTTIVAGRTLLVGVSARY